MWAVFNFSFIPMVYFLYPETKGLHLEQIDHLFEGKAEGLGCLTQGVRESIKSPPTLHGMDGRSSDEEKATVEMSEGSSQMTESKENVTGAATNIENATRG